MQTIIRKALRKDCQRIHELMKHQGAHPSHRQEVTTTVEELRASGFDREDPLWRALVAEVNNTVVGMALYYIRYSAWINKIYYLDDLIVDPNIRSKGIGRQLLMALVNEAKENKVQCVTWQVNETNLRAIKFYSKFNPDTDSTWINYYLEPGVTGQEGGNTA